MKKLMIPAVAGGLIMAAGGQEVFAASGQEIVNKALAFEGTPYAYGAPAFSTASFDCSSFTQYIYKVTTGTQLPRTSAAQAAVGKVVDRNSLQVGDLLFFDTDGDHSINHVGIYAGGGRMVSAESSVGVHLTNVFSGGGSASYWSPRFVTARRVLAGNAGVAHGSSGAETGGSQAAVYTVRSGDSLWLIGRKYGVSVSALKSMNQLHSDLIFPGQKLKVAKTAGSQDAKPSASTGNAVQKPASNQGSSSASLQKTYTVKSGDSLWLIGRKYGVSVSALKSMNRLHSDLIFPGQKLKLNAAVSGSSANIQQTVHKPAATSQKDSASAQGTYSVKKGDSLWEIATLKGISVNKLMRANNLSSIIIYPGQHLIIPR